MSAGPAQASAAGTGERRERGANCGAPGLSLSASFPAEDRLLRKRVVRAGQGGSRPLPGQEVSVKVLGALEDGGLVERDPRLIFVPGHGDVVQVSPNRCAVQCRADQRRPASPAVPVHRLWSWASPPCSPGRFPSSSPLSPTPMAARAGTAGGQEDQGAGDGGQGRRTGTGRQRGQRGQED